MSWSWIVITLQILPVQCNSADTAVRVSCYSGGLCLLKVLKSWAGWKGSGTTLTSTGSGVNDFWSKISFFHLNLESDFHAEYLLFFLVCLVVNLMLFSSFGCSFSCLCLVCAWKQNQRSFFICWKIEAIVRWKRPAAVRRSLLSEGNAKNKKTEWRQPWQRKKAGRSDWEAQRWIMNVGGSDSSYKSGAFKDLDFWGSGQAMAVVNGITQINIDIPSWVVSQAFTGKYNH